MCFFLPYKTFLNQFFLQTKFTTQFFLAYKDFWTNFFPAPNFFLPTILANFLLINIFFSPISIWVNFANLQNGTSLLFTTLSWFSFAYRKSSHRKKHTILCKDKGTDTLDGHNCHTSWNVNRFKWDQSHKILTGPNIVINYLILKLSSLGSTL